MALLRVPKQYVGGLVKFLQLSDEDSEKLLSALEQITICKKPRNIIKGAVSSLGTIPRSDVESISDALMSLFAIWNYEFKSSSDLAREVVGAIDESTSEELKQLSDDARSKIEPRLVRLFLMASLALSVKADARRFDYDKVFSYARVSSDIRPIFGSDAKEAIKVAVLSHMLNIHYIHEGDHKDFYVALDEVDLKSLKEQIERATLKSDNLKSILVAAKVEYLAPE